MKNRIIITTATLILLMTGCAQKKTISPGGIDTSTTGHSTGTDGSIINGSTAGNGSTVYQNVDPYGSGNYENGNYGYNQNGSYSNRAIQNIYFNVDQYNITADKLATITSNANLLRSDISKGAKLKLEGHCDASGTDEYNYALGLRRAKSAKDALIMKGLAAKSIALVSMGESSPECTSSSSSGCYSKNRRVEFKIVE